MFLFVMIIIYLSIGVVITALNEIELEDNVDKYFIVLFFWPIVFCVIVLNSIGHFLGRIIRKITRKDKV